VIGETVLVVEDDPDDEALILRALKKIIRPEDIVVARDPVDYEQFSVVVEHLGEY